MLVLNGGDEFKPGNEPQDRLLVAAAAARPARPAYVVPTAAARQGPERAVATARKWFARLGLEVEELPVLTRTHANSAGLAEQARGASLFYLVGGDPGHVARVLAGSVVWSAMVEAWSGGAAVAGSSAGAMALCQWTLVMARWPRHDVRRAVPALGLVPGVTFLPHFEVFGRRWADSEIVDAPEVGMLMLGVDERTAAVWRDGGWLAEGPGRVTVISAADRQSYGAGETVLGLPQPRTARPER